MKWLLLLVLPPALALPAAAQAQIVTGSATAVDGDSLDLAGVRVRLFGIDAPEGTQTCHRDGAAWSCGEDAKAALAQQIAGQSITCEQRDRDAYGRVVAVCTAGEIDLADVQARAGMAVALTGLTQDYTDAEARAKQFRLGIWSSEFQQPAEFRATDPTFLNHAERLRRAEQREASQPSRRAAVFYRGCHEVRAAGAAPLYRGQPGYRVEMDGDLDGIACEPIRRR